MTTRYLTTIQGLLNYAIFLWAWSPAVVFAIAYGVSFALRMRRWNIPWKTLSAVLAGLLVVCAVSYLFLPVLFEETEAAIAGISAIAMRGCPVYHAPDAAQRYSLLYGPVTFLAHIPFYLAFGLNLFSFKLLGVLALLTSLCGIYRICRNYAPPATALVGLGAASLVLFRYLDVAFWGRIDPLILCMVVICLWTILELPVGLAIPVNAIAFSVVPNLKLSGAVYLLPVFGFLAIRRGWRAACITAAGAALLFPLPFALPQVSWPNYVFMLKAAGENGLSLEFFLRNAQYSVLMLLPVLAVFRRASGSPRPSPQQVTYLALIALAMAFSAVAGSKNGAGSYHLIPYIVPIVHLFFWMRSGSPIRLFGQPISPMAAPWVMAMLAFSLVPVRFVVYALRDSPQGQPIISEIHRAESTYHGATVELGFGGDFFDRRMEYVSIPVFDGQPYTFSASAVKDLQLSGIAMGPATIRYLETCGTKVWLIPKGNEPFSANNNYYGSGHPAFDAPFRNAFLSHYRKAASGERFDIWTCGN